LVTGLNPCFGGGASFVDAHFTAADDAIDMRFGYALQMTHQKVVQTLSSRLFVHFQAFDGRCSAA
jgi:hypothetical protein